MTGPVVTVTTTETPASAGTSLSTGTAFIVGMAIYGPETPQLVRSLSEAKALYPREGAGIELYDALNTFFSTGGSRAYVNRVQGAGSPAAAKLEIGVTAKEKILVVTAKYKGTYGNSIKLEVVENAGKTANSLKILNPSSELLEQSTFCANATELLEWGETHKTYVEITTGSEYAAEKAKKIEKLAPTKLAGGLDPTNNEADTITAIEGFPRSLGPGQLIVASAEGFKEGVHKAMGEHASKANRIALCDLKEAAKANTTAATLIGEKGTYVAGIKSYMMFFTSACTVQGITLGTTRTVPASAVVAGLCAQVSRTGNDNQAPAGENWSLSPYVTGFVNNYKQAETEELSTAGINAFKEVSGTPCLYGFVSALSHETDLIFWQATASRERMALVSGAETIGNRYLFKTIDGRRRLLSHFQGDLQGMIKEHWEHNALFGATAPESGIAQTGEPINTLTTMQNGELNSELIVRISPYANVVQIIITSTPIFEAV